MKIHTLLLSTTLFITTAMAADTSTQTTNTEVINTDTTALDTKQEGIKYIKMLGGALKSELKAHMKADKTGLSAAGFCASKATSLTAEVNAKLPKYAKVRRTALKLRNTTKNPADTLDNKIMDEYVAAIEAKTFTPKDIKIVQIGDTTRVYKPLVTAPVCLKCHGSNVSKEIKEIIHASYPDDKAMDFKEGSLRGVIVAEIKKH